MSTNRRTLVAPSRLAMRELRLAAARDGRHGSQIMSIEQLALRLAGGFSIAVNEDALRLVIQEILPVAFLGELESIKMLPGMVAASAATLQKAWLAGIDLQARSGGHPRLASIAALEAEVLAQLPPAMMRPADLVAAACRRIQHARALLGPVEIVGATEMAPCWRPLLKALTAQTPVHWSAGPRKVPDWVEATGIIVSKTAGESPAISAVSAATAYHEAIEALRWARKLLAAGEAEAEDIAIAAASTAEYDDHFLSLRADANLDLHHVHGVKVTSTREGQTAAALADILIRGLSQVRVRRLATLCGSKTGPFRSLPDGWQRVLPADAPLTSLQAWTRLLHRLRPADWPEENDQTGALAAIVSLLAKGLAAAEETGETLLQGRARDIWRKALLAGPPASLDTTLDAMKQDDGLEACVCIAWMSAATLAASPRRFVRLIGMNASRWPRGMSEDRLIPDHIVPVAELDPFPAGAADRRDFETILATTGREIVLSRSRRDGEGRLLGRSPLLGHTPETYVRRNAVPVHAFSETDRLMARPKEFAAAAQAISASGCWRDWQREEATAHDGLVRPDHPVMLEILERNQSASSLQLLLRNPLAFVWKYGMHWRSPESGADPLVLDPLGLGNLVHETLDCALRLLNAAGGLAQADAKQVGAAIVAAAAETAEIWESGQAVPPEVIWRRTLEEARRLSGHALNFAGNRQPGTRSFGEVPFGGTRLTSGAEAPWDVAAVVDIPETGFRISGSIDRLDIFAEGREALVSDYKTGKTPKKDFVLKGGGELQRCLYAFAAKALLGHQVSVDAALFYPRDQIEFRLKNPETTLTEVTGYLRAARANLLAGHGLIGPDAGGNYDDLAFALPANAGATYLKRKLPAVTELLGDAAKVWEAV